MKAILGKILLGPPVHVIAFPSPGGEAVPPGTRSLVEDAYFSLDHVLLGRLRGANTFLLRVADDG